jgi:uncharacterized repeat protein (TIGR01451 family)
MSNAASKLMWVRRAKRALAFALAMGTALAASLLVLATRPAEAAFPGTNGKIVFASNRAAPDGSTDYEIYVMNANAPEGTTNVPQRLTNNGRNDREPVFSSDGSKIAFSRDGTIWVMNADGSDQVQLTSGSEPTFSPDGEKIAYTDNQDIFVMDADGSGTPTNLTNDAPANFTPAWSPDGSKIAFATGPDSGITGELERSRDSDILVMDADGTGAPTLLHGDGPNSSNYSGPLFHDYAPAWSPDGSKIAFHTEIGNDSNISVKNSDGTGHKTGLFNLNRDDPLGTDTGIQANPAFSPNGSKITFRRNTNIFVGRADGSGTPTNVTSGPAMETEPDWGPLSHDLSVFQSDSPDPAKVNNNLTYTLKVKNEGYDAAPGVVLTDRLPSGVTFVSASNGCTHSAGKVTCKLGSVAGVTPANPTGTTVTKTITVKPTAQDTITNIASVKSSAVEVAYTGNNTDRERTEVSLNRAPVANDDSYVTAEDTPLTVAAPGVLADDTDTHADPLQVNRVLQTTSSGTLTWSRDGSFTYTPNKNFNGSDAFTYTATDGTAQSNVATATIVVRAVNDAPKAQDDSAQTEMNTPLNINVLANDRDAERDDISITNVSDPANGTATLNSDGTVRYAPDTDYLGFPGYHYLGPDSFTYTVSDGNGGTDTATVNIKVKDTKVPDAPVITSPANNTIDNDGSFTISGTAEPYTSVEIFDGGNSLNMAAGVFNPEGTWFFELRNVSEGSHSYTVKTIDRAGNTSAASEALTVIVDKTP